MILSSLLLSLIQVLFVTWFVIRTIRKYSSVFLLKKSALTKIGTGLLCITFTFSLSFDPHSPLFFTPSAFVFLLMFALPFVITRALENRCQNGFQRFIDGVVLDMKCGKSLLSAFKQQSSKLPDNLNAFLQDRLLKDGSNHTVSPALSLKSVSIYISEFQKIASQNARQLDRLVHLQKQMRLDALLRHRSSQALLQTKIQCTFLTFIYFCVSLYGLKTYHWTDFKPFFLTSLVLLAFGLLLLVLLTRKKNWKT